MIRALLHNVMRDLFERMKVIFTSDIFFFKTKFVAGIIKLTLLKSKALFSSFCMVGNNPSDSSVSFETFFSGNAEASNLLLWQNKSLICRENVTENKVKSSDYEFNILRKCHTRKFQNEFQFFNTSKQKLLWRS